MTQINAAWHSANRMPKNATIDQRIEWHLAHRKACGCRKDLPATIIKELKRRGLPVPATRHSLAASSRSFSGP